MFRTIILSLMLLIVSVGIPFGYAAMQSSQSSQNKTFVGKRKSKKKVRRYSKAWWRRHRAKIRRRNQQLALQRKRFAMRATAIKLQSNAQQPPNVLPVPNIPEVVSSDESKIQPSQTAVLNANESIETTIAKPEVKRPVSVLNSATNTNTSNFSDEISVVSESAVNETTISKEKIVEPTETIAAVNSSKLIHTRYTNEKVTADSDQKAFLSTITNRADGGSSEPRTMSLKEVISMTLANNKDIEIGRQSVLLAEYDLKEASAISVPKFTSFAGQERQVLPAFSVLNGGINGRISQSSFTTSSSLDGKFLKTGSSYNVNFTSAHNVTNDQLIAFSPNYSSALSLNLTQPLLRNYKVDKERRAIEISKKNLQLADAQFRRNVVELVTASESAYWDLTYALKSLQIQNEMLRDARAQLEHTQRMVLKGMMAPVDAASAELQVANFERNTYSAIEAVSRAENALKNLITENPQSALWSTSVVTTEAIDAQIPSISLPDALKTAAKNRAELQQSEILTAVNEIDREYYRNQLKPQVDLVANYTVGGYSGFLVNDRAAAPLGQFTEPIQNRINALSQLNNLPLLDQSSLFNRYPGSLTGGYAQTIGNLFTNQFPSFRFGISVSFPLKNQAAEAQLGRSLVEGERIRTQREKAEQTIQVEVRNAYQSVRAAELRLSAAITARRAAEEQYGSVQRKFASGYSTVFQVMERQTVLAASRDQEIRAKIELRKAMAELQRATGDSLTLNNILVANKN